MLSTFFALLQNCIHNGFSSGLFYNLVMNVSCLHLPFSSGNLGFMFPLWGRSLFWKDTLTYSDLCPKEVHVAQRWAVF